jgi:heme-degrading monooxygenase HmoA
MTEISSERDVLTVIFEFDVEPDEQQPLRASIEALVRDIVSRQPGFLSADLHLSRDGRKVLNYFQWETLEAFERFRADETAQSRIRPVIGPYGPTPRIYDIVSSTAPSQAPTT